MSDAIARLRMFAGPNGSGKTTIKRGLSKPEAWFGPYINPDDLELALRQTGEIDFGSFGVTTDAAELRACLATSELLRANDLTQAADAVEYDDGKLRLPGVAMNSYYAAVLADFLRQRLLDASRSFSFETVMSAPDKVALLKNAQARGYRTYLYYVATDDPSINVMRVRYRVAEGGHDVPEDKIRSRYTRSLNLLREAIRYTNRAYFFDTTDEDAWFFAEITEGSAIELKFSAGEVPGWFKKAVWERF